MGDRGNIAVMFGEKKKVWLYTHWEGSQIGDVLQAALINGRDRWSDAQYLTRIIFQRMIGKDSSTTGFGISPDMCDNEHNILMVDPDKQVVIETEETGKKIRQWTFDKFINIEYKEKVD